MTRYTTYAEALECAILVANRTYRNMTVLQHEHGYFYVESSRLVDKNIDTIWSRVRSHVTTAGEVHVVFEPV